jgi:hypothetical protein
MDGCKDEKKMMDELKKDVQFVRVFHKYVEHK